MSDLITRERALRNLNNLSLSAAEALLLDALIAAASRAVEAYCGRALAEARFDEVYDGTRHAALLLKQSPVVRVERVAYGPAAVLRVTNTSASSQRATVQVIDTGLVLTRVASGVTTTSTLLFADHVTLAALATAVTALGNGWSAAVADGAYNLRASADLQALQGAFAAKDAEAELRLHTGELSAFDVDHAHGILTRGAGWAGGSRYWRVTYHAGYAAVPDDVQEACAEWVAALFWQGKRDPGQPPTAAATQIPASTRVLLAPYRRVHI